GSVSFGNGCGLATQYGVYARDADAALRAWIEGHLPPPSGPGPAQASAPATTGTTTTAPSVSARPRIIVALARTRAGARRLVVRLRSTAVLHGVRARLARGGATVAVARVAHVSAPATLVLRARSRLRPGRYRLGVTARDAEGRSVTARRWLSVRR
ncbi:MAG TPA: hypothetical protein VGJ70_04185, partial [Solirubrobacteraceae bacterium]